MTTHRATRAGLALLAASVLWTAACGREPRVDATLVTARRIAAPVSGQDVDSAVWRGAPEHPARLMVQDVTEPRLTEPGVDLVRVRAAHDGTTVAFRLEWNDRTEDLVPDGGRASDAVAIQFPLVSGADVPDPAMGQPGKGVRIWYWRAAWQDDERRAAAGEGDRLATLHPNASIDHYPFDAAPLQPGSPVAAEMATRYAPARAAANPITVRPSGGGAVQVLEAEGFGNTDPAAAQAGSAVGRWRDGRWTAVITRPIDAGADLAPLKPGERTYVALAVWDGSARHTGSRKMRSGWIPLVLAR
jgi:DMSO reductase family type II enzyme heme b subunit